MIDSLICSCNGGTRRLARMLRPREGINTAGDARAVARARSSLAPPGRPATTLRRPGSFPLSPRPPKRGGHSCPKSGQRRHLPSREPPFRSRTAERRPPKGTCSLPPRRFPLLLLLPCLNPTDGHLKNTREKQINIHSLIRPRPSPTHQPSHRKKMKTKQK